jgi:DNA repair exonuclease SbcCD nuclease subunit
LSTLITSDLHLTDRDRDEYRWSLFPWIIKQIPRKPHRIETLLFLGDTTDAKDKHSAKLTNRIVDTFTQLSEYVDDIHILRGNHDYINESMPFFRFLSHIKGIEFVTEEWQSIKIGNRKVMLVPNTKNFAHVVNEVAPTDWDFLFCHQTFKGAVSENGMEMEGLDAHMFDKFPGTVISGDIHVPQRLNDKITYVGAPYPIRFGDSFEPRLLLIDNDYSIKSLPFETLHKHTLDISNPAQLKKIKIQKGDQVKVRLSLEDAVDWEEYKTQVIEFCAQNEVDLHQIEFKKQAPMVFQTSDTKIKDLTPREIFMSYCEQSKIGPDTQQYGTQIIEEKLK